VERLTNSVAPSTVQAVKVIGEELSGDELHKHLTTTRKQTFDDDETEDEDDDDEEDEEKPECCAKRTCLACVRVILWAVFLMLSVLSIIGAIILRTSIAIKSEEAGKMKPSSDFSQFPSSCTIMGVVYDDYDYETEVPCDYEPSSCKGAKRELAPARMLAARGDIVAKKDDANNCVTKVNACMDRGMTFFTIPGQKHLDPWHQSRIEENQRCLDCNCASTSRETCKTDPWQAAYKKNETVTCWKPTGIASTLPPGYRCGNGLCYKIFDPQEDENKNEAAAKDLLVSGALCLDIGLPGMLVLCCILFGTSTFNNPSTSSEQDAKTQRPRSKISRTMKGSPALTKDNVGANNKVAPAPKEVVGEYNKVTPFQPEPAEGSDSDGNKIAACQPDPCQLEPAEGNDNDANKVAPSNPTLADDSTRRQSLLNKLAPYVGSRLLVIAHRTRRTHRLRGAHLFRDAVFKLFVLVFFCLPFVSVVLAAVFGALLALIEDWSFEDCFWIVLKELTSTEVSIVELPRPDSDFGKIAGCCVGVVSLAVLGLMIAIMGGPLLDPVIKRYNLQPSRASSNPLRESINKLLAFMFCVIPVFAIALSAVLGGLLSVCEGGAATGWSFTMGFYVVLAELTGTGMDIVDSPHPQRTIGKLMACMIGLWSLAIFGGLLGITGGPLLNPIIDALGAEARISEEMEEKHRVLVRADQLSRASKRKGGAPVALVAGAPVVGQR
jgi:hypothetical protein